MTKAVRDCLAYHHGFSPKDERAVFVFDAVQEFGELQIITTGIKVLLGFIGLLTLGIGGVGLMNIMLVSVTQRTREIGVEKALGRASLAHPVSVSGGGAGNHLHRWTGRSCAGLPGFVVGGITCPCGAHSSTTPTKATST